MSKKSFITGLIITMSAFCFAQTDQQKSYVDSPAWIQMMNDPKTNYYEAIKAYDEYWKMHVKPVMEEEEEMGAQNESNGERKRELNKKMKRDKDIVLTEEQIKAKNEEETMRYQIKRFEQWEREVLPYVQDDGRILSDEERKAIWQKQQDELQKQKN